MSAVRSETPELPEEPDHEPAAAPALPVNLLEQRLFKQRRVLVFGTIDDKLARDVVARLLALSAESTEPIDVFVSSPGGHVESGDAIHDMIRFVDAVAPVRIIGTGWVGSAAATIYLSAPKARRLCLPNTRFLLHQPAGGARGQAADIAIEAREIVKIRERINRLIAAATGQPLDKVALDTDRNHWMNADEAIDYGVVGRIVQTLKDL